MASLYDPGTEGARMPFAGAMAYGDYLSLDMVPRAQHPPSDAGDQVLFIIQHQTQELWLKLMLRELGRAREAIAADRPSGAKGGS